MVVQWSAFLAVAVISFLACAHLLRRGRAISRVGATVVVVTALGAGVAGAAAWDGRLRRAQAARQDFFRQVPPQESFDGYVSSDTCRACHPSQHDSWHRSYHRSMTQYPSRDSVKAPFSGVAPLALKDGHLELGQRGDEFWMTRVQRTAAGETRRPQRVDLVTGSHHMQMFWVASGEGGNAQALMPYAYVFDARRWLALRDTFIADPTIQWQFDMWNTQCVQCHATAGQPRPRDDKGRAMDTRVVETGIACEACHGPAAAHVAVNSNPLRRYLTHLRGQGDPTIVNPARLSRQAQVDVCAQCHGVTADVEHPRFLREGFSYRPGGTLQSTRYLLAPGEPVSDRYLVHFEKQDPGFFRNNFWPDGMVRTTGREASGMVRSKCYLKGELTCRSCHSPHDYVDADDQLTPAAAGNDACLQCHQPLRAQVSAHTHHAADSPGSQCYNCHMPFTSFGLLKATRGHQITRPVASSTEVGGRPNACNLCHLDRTRQWAAEKLTAWYGQPAVELSDEDRTFSTAAMLALRGDAVQRAITNWSMGWAPARAASGDEWQAAYLALGLSDSYSVVRYVAGKALRLTPGLGDIDYDFAGRPEAIEASQQRIIGELGRALRPVATDKAARLFMRDNGTLQTDRVAAQLDRRDNTPIEHKE